MPNRGSINEQRGNKNRVLSDGTLRDAVRGCWHVLLATIQVMIFSLISLQVIRPDNFSNCMAALAVATGAFVVALPKSTHLLTKRIAYGQLVIVYVRTVIHGPQEGVATHSIHVACSTALGAIASRVEGWWFRERECLCGGLKDGGFEREDGGLGRWKLFRLRRESVIHQYWFLVLCAKMKNIIRPILIFIKHKGSV
ncbi:hypothetical protein MtrunA17_Chr7g0244781 [Medicago truncatula]|uniref:Transmembrane protein n=1 Tax=Medicago truncatula TaxID=3880 RepID=A0A396H677_MEDTR|nr:hypothetical protein MtrunA17_Chr7g0244781 [Medicago truncatula]